MCVLMHSADGTKSYSFVVCPLHDVGKDDVSIRPTVEQLKKQLRKELGSRDPPRDNGL